MLPDLLPAEEKEANIGACMGNETQTIFEAKSPCDLLQFSDIKKAYGVSFRY